jgi:hypothetical protein
MIHTLLAAALWTSLAAAQPAVAKDGPPRTPPPVVMIAGATSEGVAYIEKMEIQFVPETRTEQVKVGNRIENVVTVVTVPVQQVKRFILDGKDVQVYGSDGKKISLKDVPRLLKKATPVLVSADGKKVDPFYLRLAREGTLVVVSPALVAAAIAAPPPLLKLPEKVP